MLLRVVDEVEPLDQTLGQSAELIDRLEQHVRDCQNLHARTAALIVKTHALLLGKSGVSPRPVILRRESSRLLARLKTGKVAS